MSILENIINIMKEKGISQKELCDKLNLPKSLFSHWKSDRNRSYMKMLLPISQVLGVDVTSLYGIEEILPTNNSLDFELSQEEKDLIVLFHNMTAEQKSKIKSLALSLSLED